MRRFDFNIGAEVRCKDGQYGKLAGVVVDPETRQVINLIVEKGFLLTHDRVLPLSVAQSAMEDAVYLSINSYDLEQYPEYRVIEYEEPVTGLEQPATDVVTPYGIYGPTERVVPMVKKKIREGISSGQQVIENGMPVNNLDRTIGKVDHVVADRESKELTHLVVYRGLIFTDRIIIPISMVEDIHEEGIFVSCTNEEVEQLPHYDAEREDLTE